MKWIKSRVFIAVVFFVTGFLANHFLTKMYFLPSDEMSMQERIPINPNDFDPEEIQKRAMESEQSDLQNEIKKIDDGKNIVYEIPLEGMEEANKTIKVEVKEGMIIVHESIKHTSGEKNSSVFESTSEQQFSIDPGLDEAHAKVETLKDKIIIKIPKK